MKKVMAATAVILTFKSGGFIDMAGDHFSDAGDVAADALEVPEAEIPDELDGIAFEDYSPEAQANIIADEEARVELEAQARQAVIELFERVDDEGYESLKTEVNEYKAAHPEMFVDGAAIEAAHEAIDSAGTNKDVLNALGEFMSFYGAEVGFYDDEAFDDKEDSVKEISNAFVDVYSVLPKDFIELAQVSKLTISDEAVADASGQVGTEMGTYSTSGEITVVAGSKLFNILKSAEGFVQRTDASYQGIIAHELGHALEEQLAVGVELPGNAMVDLELEDDESIPFMPYVEHIGRNIINRPEAPSVYAKSGQGEFNAEILSGLLSDRSNGLATTDEWRKFGSASNKVMIQMLADLERAYPGIAKILVANRAN